MMLPDFAGDYTRRIDQDAHTGHGPGNGGDATSMMLPDYIPAGGKKKHSLSSKFRKLFLRRKA
jgi:hypothetical protein